MKYKQLQLLLPISIIASYLFYKQACGINILIFTLISILFIALSTVKSERKKLLSFSVPALLCSVSIMILPQTITFLLWMISFAFLWQVRLLVDQPLDRVYTFLKSFENGTKQLAHMDYLKQQDKAKAQKKIIIIAVSSFITLVFLILYVNSNPVFKNLTSKIDLSFIEAGFVFLTLSNYFIFYCLNTTITNPHVLENKQRTSIAKTELQDKDHTEFSISRITLWILFGLLGFINITDLVVIVSQKLPEGMSYSQFVHQGFNMLIFSMTLAIGLVLFFFRGRLNFHERLKLIQRSSKAWLLQNLLLVLITFYKNGMYVHTYGLTYKRLFVCFGLICTTIGILLAIRKIKCPKTNWFFINRVSYYAYFSFLAIGLLPIDRLITFYNINYAQQKDINYLIDLEQPNLNLIKEYIDGHDVKAKVETKYFYKKQKYNDTKKNLSWKEWNYCAYDTILD